MTLVAPSAALAAMAEELGHAAVLFGDAVPKRSANNI